LIGTRKDLARRSPSRTAGAYRLWGASGAIAAVLGAFRIPAWFYLGAWFLYQLVEADSGLFSASANGGGVAFFAHVGGFIFGVLIARLMLGGSANGPAVRHGAEPPIAHA
jgi:membrane associated rhomboid family serine protease